MQRHSHKLLMAVLAVLLVLAASEAVAGGHPHHGHHGGYHYGHYRGYGYPTYGYSAHYRGSPYYYGGGAWYRPYGARFVVVAPPIGIGLSFLSPYYYARREYVVAEPPQRQADTAELYAYPRNGQSEERQAVDRDDCHRWAVVKAGFDPTKSVGANHDLSNFRRAETACLDARGYSVK